MHPFSPPQAQDIGCISTNENQSKVSWRDLRKPGAAEKILLGRRFARTAQNG
jgi:hypothetical protein